MANVFVEEQVLTNIGNAIRSKTGKSDLILPADMAGEIDGIPQSGAEGEGIIPSGTVTITSNKDGIDVKPYAFANVRVPQGVFPEGTLYVTENNKTYDVTSKASVNVQVPTESGSGGVTLPTLSNPASASDLAKDKQLIDANGNVVTGNLKQGNPTHSTGTAELVTTNIGTMSVKFINSKAIATNDRIIRSGDEFFVSVTANNFGDATINDVRSGVKFTSQNGVLLEGQMDTSNSGGVTLPTLTNPGTSNDLAKDVQLIGANGEIIEGSLDVWSGINWSNVKPTWKADTNEIWANASSNTRRIYDNINVTLKMPASNFGTATTTDVREGVTFTSENGLLLRGEMTGSGSGGSSLPAGAIAIQIVTGAETSTKVGSGYSLSVTYGDAVEINDSIALAFAGTTQTLSNISGTTNFSVLNKKYIRTGSSYSASYYYIPDGAAFTVGGQGVSKTLTCNRAQSVTIQKVSV